MIFMTRLLNTAGWISRRIAVMYSGEIVEIGEADAITERPRHPYTAGLLKTAMSLERGDSDLYEISGEPGSLTRGDVCRFSPRCPDVIASCRTMHPLLVKTEPGLSIRCIRHDR